MSTAVEVKKPKQNEYPTSDGKPMAETDRHRDLSFDFIYALKRWYEADEQVYVSGNLLIFYEPGNKRRHVAPDVFVVKGVPKRERVNYLIWEEGKGPDIVFEFTSSSTKSEDTKKKFALYQDLLQVQEYFLFDPYGDYLRPRLQGYRMEQGKYESVRGVEGRLLSRVLDLELSVHDQELRLWDPKENRWLPTPADEADELKQTIAENERLKRELEELQRRTLS